MLYILEMYIFSLQTSNTESLTLPVKGQVLEILLDYIYTDKSAVITGTYNFVCLFVA